ncbi:hypothetical protein [Methylomonas koyamae]|uniref:hypothetical protein n=1 Tax=Methylomonas koyamae TaxID=702114 RepID=UPI0006D18714|nr:hypothetical protein [Methylomonas koyamae]
MGIEDRDYYREKLRNQARQQSAPPARADSAGALRYLLMPLAALAGLWYGADALLAKQAAAKHPLPEVLLSAADGSGRPAGTVRIKPTAKAIFAVLYRSIMCRCRS